MKSIGWGPLIALAIVVGMPTITIAEESEETIEEVVVTGSRIQRDGYTTPTPVTVASREELVMTTPTSLADGLNKLPQFQMSTSPARSVHNFVSQDTHGNLLNLRSLGPTRTLILMDGMRLPPTNYPGTFDVGVIPNLLVDRVETVTGGASAAYGADAVAGVVNFVLDTDYTGIKALAQGGVDDQGDNGNERFALAGGFDFADGRGHVLLSGDYYNHDGMKKSDRKTNADGWMWLNVGGTYQRIKDGLLTTASEGGLIVGAKDAAGAAVPFSLSGQQFLADGTVGAFDKGSPGGVFTSGGDGYTIPLDTSGVSAEESQHFFGRVSYEFSDELSGYVQGVVSNQTIRYTGLANSLNTTRPVPIFTGNPFLPASVQAAMTDEGVDYIEITEYAEDSPLPEGIEETDFTMIGAGLEGALSGDWRWRLDASYGRSEHAMDQYVVYQWARTYAALDAVDDGSGNIVCAATIDPRPEVRSAFAGCQPLNILGGDPSQQTPAGWDYATGVPHYDAVFKQTAISASASGTLFEMPAGPVDLGFGIDYRSMEFDLASNSDPALLDGFDENGNPNNERDAYYGPLDDMWHRNLPQRANHIDLTRGEWYWLTNIGIANAEDKVSELFAEVNVPLLSGSVQWDVNGAFRYTDYDSSGDVDTWKLGTQLRPVDSLLIRATYSSDIRAPSLFNIGRGNSYRIGFLDDPVSGVSANITTVDQANPNLKPEESETYTVGFVLTPASIPGLSLAMDYYSIEIEGAISSGLGASQLVDACIASNGTSADCDQVIRRTPTSFPDFVIAQEGNFAAFETAGIDVELSYTTQAFGGELGLHGYLNYLDTYTEQTYPTSPVLDYRGAGHITGSLGSGRPEFMGTLNVTYKRNAFSAALTEQYIHSLDLKTVGNPAAKFNPNSINAVNYIDLSLMYDFGFGDSKAQAFVTINNLMDKEPPLVPTTLPSSSPVTIIGVYDHIGRAYVAGIRMEL